MARAIRLAGSGIAFTGSCKFHGFLLGCDGVNDITDLTVYDGVSAAGREIVPTSDYEADYMGLNGVTGRNIECSDGVYVEFTCAGTAEVVLDVTPN